MTDKEKEQELEDIKEVLGAVADGIEAGVNGFLIGVGVVGGVMFLLWLIFNLT